MPPRTRTAEEIDREKENIIKNAMDIMEDIGFECFTMRALAKKLGTSPTYIYQYFTNKDELYLHILTRGFSILQDLTEQAVSKETEPRKRLEVSMTAFLNFAWNHYCYFYLMYSTTDFKCMDYLDTPFKDIAIEEKAVAFIYRDYCIELLRECLPWEDDDTLLLISTHIRCSLHGVIHLYKTNILREIGIDYEPVAQSAIQLHLTDIKSRIKQDKSFVSANSARTGISS